LFAENIKAAAAVEALRTAIAKKEIRVPALLENRG